MDKGFILIYVFRCRLASDTIRLRIWRIYRSPRERKLKVVIDYSAVILFGIFILGGYLFARLVRRRTLSTDDLLQLVWQSVAFALTTMYVIGTVDYIFFQSSNFEFSLKDIWIIALPGAVCIAILAASVYYKYINKVGRRGKK